ncbi:hypothetical protein [Nocardia sp. BMG51109]|nr:hypothetical protein [Nocardia sp. BMG51109]
MGLKGQGRRQRAILQLMADRTPRTMSDIGKEVGLTGAATANTESAQ